MWIISPSCFTLFTIFVAFMPPPFVSHHDPRVCGMSCHWIFGSEARMKAACARPFGVISKAATARRGYGV